MTKGKSKRRRMRQNPREGSFAVRNRQSRPRRTVTLTRSTRGNLTRHRLPRTRRQLVISKHQMIWSLRRRKLSKIGVKPIWMVITRLTTRTRTHRSSKTTNQRHQAGTTGLNRTPVSSMRRSAVWISQLSGRVKCHRSATVSTWRIWTRMEARPQRKTKRNLSISFTSCHWTRSTRKRVSILSQKWRPAFST